MIAAGEDFSALPAAVARALGEDGGPRCVVVVLLDAFGWRFAQRHAQHPLLARAARDGTLAPLASQFPSTTTAHVTTMHTGLPVGAHGLYEWRVLEPSAGRVVVPFLVGPEDGYDPRGLLPQGPSFYQRLAARGIASQVFSPARFSPSTYDGAAVRGAPLHPYGELADGARALAAAVAAAEEKLYAYLYFDGIDVAGHRHGPSSPEFDDAALRTLDAVYTAFFGPEAPAIDDTLLVLTADHGQVDVSPDRVDDLDVLVPDLESRLTQAPAGSARDVFLHVAADRVAETIADLAAALEDRATVHAVADLVAAGAFGTAGPRLRERLATVCVLPSPGRMAWLTTHADVERAFRGHHGGRTPDEATTFLATLPMG
ncbi:MAG: alkaline phosphatase family protein [Conexibacter sp.]|nr:alkaline phosphatase family protein [Conexibacter sp.]